MADCRGGAAGRAPVDEPGHARHLRGQSAGLRRQHQPAARERGYTWGAEKLEDDQAADAAASDDLEAQLGDLVEQRLAEAEAEDSSDDEAGADAAASDAESTPDADADAESSDASATLRRGATFLDASEASAKREETFEEAARVEDESTGKVAGFALFTAEPREPRRERVMPECRQVHEENGTTPYKQGVLINPNRTLENVVVRVVNPPSDASDAKRETHLIDQIGCVYLPHVMAMTTGDQVDIHNGDPFTHNLNLKAERNRSFNVGQPVKGMTHSATFDRPEAPMHLKCDVHSCMSALLYVFDHPFHSRSTVCLRANMKSNSSTKSSAPNRST